MTMAMTIDQDLEFDRGHEHKVKMTMATTKTMPMTIVMTITLHMTKSTTFYELVRRRCPAWTSTLKTQPSWSPSSTGVSGRHNVH